MGEDDMLLPYEEKGFEDLKQVNAHGAEYWSARALQGLLGYEQWRSFARSITKAIDSCRTSGNEPNYHFARARKPIVGGKGAVQQVDDFELSRFACYLIAQNGDPRKPAIAIAQKYFAVQTRRQELSDALVRDKERVQLRKQTKVEFRALSGVAHDAGVQSRMFGVFHDAGYKGMYGGLDAAQIKDRKAIPKTDNVMDRMNTTELAANQFRLTQAREKLQRQGKVGQARAIETHNQVGKEVREAIKRIGGTMPEDLPPAEHIKKVEKRLRGAKPTLELEEKDAKGLSGKQ